MIHVASPTAWTVSVTSMGDLEVGSKVASSSVMSSPKPFGSGECRTITSPVLGRSRYSLADQHAVGGAHDGTVVGVESAQRLAHAGEAIRGVDGAGVSARPSAHVKSTGRLGSSASVVPSMTATATRHHRIRQRCGCRPSSAGARAGRRPPPSPGAALRSMRRTTRSWSACRDPRRSPGHEGAVGSDRNGVDLPWLVRRDHQGRFERRAGCRRRLGWVLGAGRVVTRIGRTCRHRRLGGTCGRAVSAGPASAVSVTRRSACRHGQGDHDHRSETSDVGRR